MADCLIQFHDPSAGQCIDVRSSSRDTFANEIANVYTGYLRSVKGDSKQDDPVYMGEFPTPVAVWSCEENRALLGQCGCLEYLPAGSIEFLYCAAAILSLWFF